MPARLLFVLAILTMAAGCAQGYYDTRPAYPQPEDTRTWYTNPETEQEYRRRIWWMDYETSHPWWRRR
jgi:type IV pilus biogenesis protein CpaD/CtpE